MCIKSGLQLIHKNIVVFSIGSNLSCCVVLLVARPCLEYVLGSGFQNIHVSNSDFEIIVFLYNYTVSFNCDILIIITTELLLLKGHSAYLPIMFTVTDMLANTYIITIM